MFNLVRSDIKSVFDRDPAARSILEVIFNYPGLHAIWNHRMAHWLWTHGLKFPARAISTFSRFFTGIEIHPAAQIGSGFFIDHGMGVVIGETAEIGHNVTLYHGVTLGGVSLEKGKRHPTLEDNVVVGAGAKVLGAITIGHGSRIGANAVVVKNVPSGSVVVGVPGQVVMRTQLHEEVPDLAHNLLPDTIGASLSMVMHRLKEIEENLNIHVTDHPLIMPIENGNGNTYEIIENIKDGIGKPEFGIIHAPENGVWRGEDFII